jgi:nucleoside-diphosphate-sugar epimerase
MLAEPMPKILVTGSQGTLGAPLLRELRRRGHETWGCDLQHQADEQVLRADIRSYRQFEQLLERTGPLDFEWMRSVYGAALEAAPA